MRQTLIRFLVAAFAFCLVGGVGLDDYLFPCVGCPTILDLK